MTITANLTGNGCPATLASAIVGGWITTEVGAGTTRLDATQLARVSNHYIGTAANNSGVILPPGNGSTDSLAPGDHIVIFNADANTLLLYPPTGGKLNNGTASTGTVTIATKTSVEAISINGLDFVVLGPTT